MSAAALLLALLGAASPFTAEQPAVRQGNEQLLSGDGAAALERYQAAEREAGPHPEIDFDRGNALHALGRHAEAREAWRRALERDAAGVLSSRALQNTGNALAAAGDRDGAVKAFSQALARDPANEDARYNLEVLLRRKAQGQGAPKDQGDQGKQGGQPEQQPGKPEQGQQDGKDQAQGQDRQGAGQAPEPEPGQAQGQPKPDQERQGDEDQPGQQPGPSERKDGSQRGGQRDGEQEGERSEGAAGRAGQLDRQDAARLLDALRDRERNMPLGPAGRKEARKRDVAKDW